MNRLQAEDGVRSGEKRQERCQVHEGLHDVVCLPNKGDESGLQAS